MNDRRIEQLTELVARIPENIRKQYELVRVCSLGGLLEQYELLEKNRAMWGRSTPLFLLVSVITLVVAVFGRASSLTLAVLALTLVFGTTWLLVHSANKELVISQEQSGIIRSLERFESVINMLDSGRVSTVLTDILTPVGIREQLIGAAEDKLRSEYKTARMRMSMEFSSASLHTALSSELVCQETFDSLWNVVSELQIPDPITQKSYDKVTIFALAQERLRKVGMYPEQHLN